MQKHSSHLLLTLFVAMTIGVGNAWADPQDTYYTFPNTKTSGQTVSPVSGENNDITVGSNGVVASAYTFAGTAYTNGLKLGNTLAKGATLTIPGSSDNPAHVFIVCSGGGKDVYLELNSTKEATGNVYTSVATAPGVIELVVTKSGTYNLYASGDVFCYEIRILYEKNTNVVKTYLSGADMSITSSSAWDSETEELLFFKPMEVTVDKTNKRYTFGGTATAPSRRTITFTAQANGSLLVGAMCSNNSNRNLMLKELSSGSFSDALVTSSNIQKGATTTLEYASISKGKTYVLVASGSDMHVTSIEFTASGGGDCTSPTIEWATEPANATKGDDDATASVTTTPTPYSVSWASNNTSVATVSSGTISYVSPGFARITASLTYSGEDYCEETVSVYKDIKVLIDAITPGANDKLWYYTSAKPSSSPDDGLNFANSKEGSGMYGIKLNSSGYAWFEKPAVSGKLRVGAYASGTDPYVVNVYACDDEGTIVGDVLGTLSTPRAGGVSGTMNIAAEVEGIKIMRSTGSEGTLYFIEFEADPVVVCVATAPGTISAGDLTDGEITLTAEGSEEDGDTWYWQSSASGTDMTTSGASITVDEAGTYYIRSYNTEGDCWSDAESYELTAEDFIPHYAITYNKGTYGTGSIDAGDKTEDVDFTLSSEMFTRENYLQVGWATTDGGSKAYNLGGSYTTNAAQTFYPVWAPKETYSFAVANEKTITTLKSEGWTFNSDEFDADPADSECYVNTVGAMNTAGLSAPHNNSMNDNAIAFAKNTDAYALFDLGYVTTVSAVTGSFNIGSTKDRKFYIEYIGSNGSTVLKTVTVNHNKEDWGANAVNETTAVANVRYIKVNSVEEKSWLVMTAFSVTYGDVTPKYTVTYALNGGGGTPPTETDKKAGAVFTLHDGTTSITAPENKEFDGWLCSANSTKYAGGAEYTMTATNTTFTAQWKAIATKYAVTYVLNGPSGDAPTETNKAEDEEFDLAEAPTWSDHVFEGWQWTDDESVTHLEDAEAEFTMPAYAVTFTAQWRLDPQATMSDAQYVIGGSALNMAAKFSSLNTSGAVLFSLKESYAGASITPAGSFTATVAGEYIVVAEQAGDGTYANGSAEATVEVLESELSDTYIWKKGAGYTGCVESPNADAPAALYTDITYEGFTGMGRATTDNTECILTFSVKNAYNSLFAIKSICTYGKFEEPAGGQISWDGGSNWEDLDKYTSEGKKEFAPAAGAYPTSFKIKFMGVSKDAGGLYWRNALVTLEAKKAIVSTVIDLTDVKINGTSISAANLSTLKTEPAYALDLADEYVTAPTVKFTKHTVITYEDESVVEKDDVISETAAVNGSGKWEASAEINDITYTVTMAKADAFVVHYYESDGKTLIGSENVAVNGHPTAADITPTPIDYKRVVWKLSGEAVDLDDVTSDVAGTEITLVASYVDAYASSINIEQWVLDNGKNNAAFRAVLDARYFKYANLNDLDSLTAEKNETDRNYPFLGQKWKLATSEISFLLKEGSTVKARFGNMGSSVNVKIGSADAVELTSADYANSSLSSSKEYSYTATEDVVVKFQGTGTGTIVFKQIMIDDAIATVKLPAIVTYDANGGSFAKESEKYTGTPLVIGDATPADDDYEFEGWHVGTVEGTKINAAAYEPTKNVTLVAKYVAKPSPFSLSALTYKIGSGDATAVGYVEGTYEYDVELPYAGSYETITVAYTLADGTSSTKAGAVLNVTSVPGAATFTVVAANTTEKTYTVNFVKDAKDGLEIIGATVTGNTSATISGLYGGTASVNLNSKKIDSGGYIYITLPSGYTFEETDVLVVNVNNKADIGTKALEITTGVGNIDGAVWKTIAFDDYSTGNNTIALTGIVANQTSIGLKRSSNQNAKINSLKVYRPLNPVLKSITFDGTKIDVTGLTAGETLPYSADLTAVTPEIFWNGAGTAVVTTNAGAWAWGDNTYVLTDKDGDATTYTITLTRAERSSDKSLSSLTVDGNAIALSEGVYDYTYVYPYGTDPAIVPVVEAVANDAHASVGDVTQAASTAGTASFTVTAEDETTQDYTVKFQISRVKELVIFDGSTMTEMATPGTDATTSITWSITGANKTTGEDANITKDGKTYSKGVNVFSTKTSSSDHYLTITIPEGYLAKFHLVGGSNANEERSLFISKEKTDVLDESIAYATSASNTTAGSMTSDFQYPGDYYLCATKSIRLYELSIQLYSIDYTRTTTPGRLGTICLEKGGTMRGATLYEVAYFNPSNQKIYFDEIIGGEMEPGMPYVFIPEEDNNNQLVVMYGNNAAAAEAGHHNGLYGSFTREELTPDAGNYIFQNNLYWYVDSEEIYVGKNRAYLKVAEILGYAGEPEPTPAPGRRRVTLDSGDQAPQITTGLENLHAGDQPVKMLINGKIFILRGEKMYDVTGKLVK